MSVSPKAYATARKLGVRPDARLLLVDPPPDADTLLGPLPPGADAVTADDPPHRLVLLFARDSATLDRALPSLAEALAPDGGLWIAWPKKSSGVPTDLSFDVVQRAGLATGLVDNKVCAIDAVWSALRFVVRRADR